MNPISKIKEVIEALPECVKPDTRLRASSSGQCPRRLDYDGIFGAPPLKAEEWMRFETGHKLHEMWTDVFTKAYGSDFASVNEEIVIHTPKGREIIGHPDGRIVSERTTVEFKNCSKAVFEMVTRNQKPLDEHLAQANLYCHAFGDLKFIILYYDRNGSQYMVFTLDYDVGLATFTLETFDLAYENRESKRVSPRPYADKTGAPCFYCPHRDRCYEGFEQDVSRADSGLLLDKEVLELTKKYWESRELRLDTEKRESAIMNGLIREVYIKRGYSECFVEDKGARYSIAFRPGKNQNLIGKVTKKGDDNE